MAKKLHLLYGLILLCFFLAACATPGDQDEFEGEHVKLRFLELWPVPFI